MENRNRRVLAAGLAAAGAMALGVGAAIAHESEREDAPAHTSPPPPGASRASTGNLASYSAQRAVTVRDRSTGEVVGMAMVRQRGAKVTAKITVAGLEPGGSHANHLHGEAPGARAKGCFAKGGHSTRHIHDFPNITANSAGVAYASFTAKVDEWVIRPGTFWMVHARPEAAGHHDKAMVSVDTHERMPDRPSQGHGSNPGIACAPIR